MTQKTDRSDALVIHELQERIGELLQEVAGLEMARKAAYQTAEDNRNAGAEWKKLAEERGAELKMVRQERDHLQKQAAEMRGYIRRVQELDPPDVIERRGDNATIASGSMPWEQMAIRR